MRLIKNICVIFLPTILITLPLVIFLTTIGEVNIINHSTNRGDNILYGVAFSAIDIEYKYKGLIDYTPDIAIIGTSRVMQFRSSSFDYPTYNAGGIISKIGHLSPLVQHIIDQDYKPKVIIVGLDQYFFNSNWDEVKQNDSTLYKERLENFSPFFIPDIYLSVRTILNNPEILFSERTINSNNIGLLGKFYNQGFRDDGSYYYGRYYDFKIYHDLNFEDTIDRINKGISRFEYNQYVNPRAIEELINFLSISKTNDIFVIGFMPPFAPSIYQLMYESNNYGYIDESSTQLKEIFDDFGYTFLDFTLIDESKDEDFIDGFHGSEKTYLYIARKISSIINEYLNQN